MFLIGCTPSPSVCIIDDNPFTLSEVDPPIYEEYPLFLEQYLTHGGTTENLEQALISWAPQSYQHAVAVETADLKNDGVDEVLVLAQYVVPGADGYWPLGQLYIFECGEHGYHLTYESEQRVWDDPLSGIFEIEDINDTGRLDVIYVSGFCSVSLCTADVQVVEWSPEAEAYVELIPGEASMSQARLSLTDDDRDGSKEIVLETSGTVSSLSIGPRFEEKVIYRWDGKSYEVAEHFVGECQVLCTPVP